MANDSLIYDMNMRLSANSAELTKGLNDGSKKIGKFKQDTQKAGNNISGIFSNMSGSFKNFSGGIVGQLGSITGNLGGMQGGLMSVLGALRGATGGLQIFKVALTSTGIGAIVVALGSLIVYLQQTQEGIDLFTKGLNIVSAVIKTVIDRLGYLGTAIVRLFQGDFAGAAEYATKAVEGFGDQIVENVNKAIDASDRQAQLEKDRIAFITKKAKLEVAISKELLKAKDQELSAEERLQAVYRAQELVNQLTKEKVRLAKEQLAIQKELDSQGENTNADNKKTAELEAELINLEKERNDRLRELTEQEFTLRNGIKATNKALEERQAALEKLQHLEDLKSEISLVGNYDLPDPSATIKEFDTNAKIAETKAREHAARMIDLSEQANNLIKATFAEGLSVIGEGIGDLISGNLGGMQNFFNSALELMLKFAEQFGKVLIAMGVGKLTLESLFSNPIAAIGAGVALVALAKAGQNIVANFNSSLSGGGGGLSNVGGLDTVSNAGVNTTGGILANRDYSNVTQSIEVYGTIKGEDIYVSNKRYGDRLATSF